MIHGSGPSPADFLLCGSEPDYRSVRAGRVFAGATGDELDRLMSLCGLSRSRVFMTNVYREQAPEQGAPHTADQFTYGVESLRRELSRVQPRHVIALGRDACRLFLGDVDMDECWGLHLKPPPEVFTVLPELRPDVTVFAQTHPGSGFHSPEASSQVLVGFENMRRSLQKRMPARFLYNDQHVNPDYRELHSSAAVAVALTGVTELACDTEGYTHAPWSIQGSSKDGAAFLIRSNNADAMNEMRLRAQQNRFSLTMHAGLHDLKVLRVMGIDPIEIGMRIDDTQLMAYLLGVIPQGLKALCVRELGMPMQSYQEVLGDAQDRHARTYLQWLWDGLNDDYQRLRQEDFDFQTKVAKRRIKVLPKLPKPALLKAAERVMGSATPFRLWNDQVLDIQVAAHSRLGAMPEASLTDVDPATALRYACRDADGTRRLKAVLEPRLDDMGLRDVYELDLGTYPILDRMMQVGIMPDLVAFQELSQTLDGELMTLRTKLQKSTGRDTFNPNSGDQVAEYLFDELQLEPLGKRTSSGRESTNDKVLEALEKAYPDVTAVADIRSYREYYKLRWTFVERLPELVNRWPRDSRIHCELMLTRTPSGRLAAKNPNLLAMPKHGKFAKAFRRCFVAGKGRLFLSADESQVELRVGAHLSQDPVMLAIFRGERRNKDGSLIDLHAAMVQRATGIDPRDQSDADRLVGKAINFGYWMGQTNIGLTLELRKAGMDVNEDDAQRWIDEANALYKGAAVYKQRMVAEAQRNGYVRCLSGRIRYVGGIRSRDDRVKSEAERFAFSTPIQEGAQYIGKRALARAWQELYVPLRKQGHWIEPILWIHDDLLSEMEADLVLTVAPALKRIMCEVPPGFTVPLDTKPEAGINWAEMVKV